MSVASPSAALSAILGATYGCLLLVLAKAAGQQDGISGLAVHAADQSIQKNKNEDSRRIMACSIRGGDNVSHSPWISWGRA